MSRAAALERAAHDTTLARLRADTEARSAAHAARIVTANEVHVEEVERLRAAHCAAMELLKFDLKSPKFVGAGGASAPQGQDLDSLGFALPEDEGAASEGAANARARREESVFDRGA